MSQIIVVGLGPGDPNLLTREAWDILSNAREVWLRTRHHISPEALPAGPEYRSFDALYESSDTFDAVYDAIAEQLLTQAKQGAEVVYAVPGHPLVGEVSVLRILERAAAEGIPTRIIAGVSFVEPTLTLLQLDPLERGLQIVDAQALANQHHPIVNVDLPLLVAQLYSRRLASDVKLTLLNAYPPDHIVTLVSDASTPEGSLRSLALHELDRADIFGDRVTLYVPPVAGWGSVDALHEVLAHLRSPEGCPWDREQTHQSIRSNLLEESYEVLAAIDAEDMEKLREELGDLLMQVLFHTQMAAEGGVFTLPQVVNVTVEKLIRRHPHVFGEVKVTGAQEVLRNWEQLKAAERGERSEERGPFDSIPTAMPALARSQEIQGRAARLGFDWPTADGVWEKLQEELAELRAAQDETAREQELGDVLFVLVNLARWLRVDAESALRGANARFTERFQAMRRLAEARGLRLEGMTLEEMDRLWNEVKAHGQDV